MIIAGIDPGLSGAVALFDGGEFSVHDVPTFSLSRNGKNKREIDPTSLAALLSDSIEHAFIEQAGSRPLQNVSGVFASGKGYGIIIGILAAKGIPVTFVHPRVWKRALAVPAAKDGARARASQLIPHAAPNWTRVKDDGRAEAALIGYWGYQTLAGLWEKPGTECIRRGWETVTAGDYARSFSVPDWPESDTIGRRRRKAAP